MRWFMSEEERRLSWRQRTGAQRLKLLAIWAALLAFYLLATSLWDAAYDRWSPLSGG